MHKHLHMLCEHVHMVHKHIQLYALLLCMKMCTLYEDVDVVYNSMNM